MKELGEKFTPPKVEAKPESKPRNGTEKKLFEEVAALRNEWSEKERREEIDSAGRKGWAKGLKQGRSEHPTDVYQASPSPYNCRAYYSNRAMPDIATSFLAGVGMEALRGSRSGERDGGGYLGRSSKSGGVYIMEKERGCRKGSFGEMSGGLWKIEDMVGRIHKRIVDADFESDLDRVRFGRYARRI